MRHTTLLKVGIYITWSQTNKQNMMAQYKVKYCYCDTVSRASNFSNVIKHKQQVVIILSMCIYMYVYMLCVRVGLCYIGAHHVHTILSTKYKGLHFNSKEEKIYSKTALLWWWDVVSTSKFFCLGCPIFIFFLCWRLPWLSIYLISG